MRHLRNSVTCRRTLLGTPHRINPLPGIGSKKAPKEHLFCAPTLQAAGPRPSATGDYVDDELDRPAAEVLDCLAHLDFDGHSHAFSPDVVWERVRQAFSCVCLPARRLLLTARVWQTQLDQSPPDNPESTPFHTFLLEVAQWVVAADFADWLAPAPAVRAAYVPTFLHSGLGFVCWTLLGSVYRSLKSGLMSMFSSALANGRSGALKMMQCRTPSSTRTRPLLPPWPRARSWISLATFRQKPVLLSTLAVSRPPVLTPPVISLILRMHFLPSDCPVISCVLPSECGLLAFALVSTCLGLGGRTQLS